MDGSSSFFPNGHLGEKTSIGGVRGKGGGGRDGILSDEELQEGPEYTLLALAGILTEQFLINVRTGDSLLAQPCVCMVSKLLKRGMAITRMTTMSQLEVYTVSPEVHGHSSYGLTTFYRFETIHIGLGQISYSDGEANHDHSINSILTCKFCG